MRRLIIPLALFLLMRGIALGQECSHSWFTGPFYVTVASSYEEPRFYPPSALVRIEHCGKCGLTRLPEKLRGYTGENLGEWHLNYSEGEVKE